MFFRKKAAHDQPTMGKLIEAVGLDCFHVLQADVDKLAQGIRTLNTRDTKSWSYHSHEVSQHKFTGIFGMRSASLADCYMALARSVRTGVLVKDYPLIFKALFDSIIWNPTTTTRTAGTAVAIPGQEPILTDRTVLSQLVQGVQQPLSMLQPLINLTYGYFTSSAPQTALAVAAGAGAGAEWSQVSIVYYKMLGAVFGLMTLYMVLQFARLAVCSTVQIVLGILKTIVKIVQSVMGREERSSLRGLQRELSTSLRSSQDSCSLNMQGRIKKKQNAPLDQQLNSMVAAVQSEPAVAAAVEALIANVTNQNLGPRPANNASAPARPTAKNQNQDLGPRPANNASAPTEKKKKTPRTLRKKLAPPKETLMFPMEAHPGPRQATKARPHGHRAAQDGQEQQTSVKPVAKHVQCYKLRKAQCSTVPECHWTVGKGCGRA